MYKWKFQFGHRDSPKWRISPFFHQITVCNFCINCANEIKFYSILQKYTRHDSRLIYTNIFQIIYQIKGSGQKPSAFSRTTHIYRHYRHTDIAYWYNYSWQVCDIRFSTTVVAMNPCTIYHLLLVLGGPGDCYPSPYIIFPMVVISVLTQHLFPSRYQVITLFIRCNNRSALSLEPATSA